MHAHTLMPLVFALTLSGIMRRLATGATSATTSSTACRMCLATSGVTVSMNEKDISVSRHIAEGIAAEGNYSEVRNADEREKVPKGPKRKRLQVTGDEEDNDEE